MTYIWCDCSTVLAIGHLAVYVHVVSTILIVVRMENYDIYSMLATTSSHPVQSEHLSCSMFGRENCPFLHMHVCVMGLHPSPHCLVLIFKFVDCSE